MRVHAGFNVVVAVLLGVAGHEAAGAQPIMEYDYLPGRIYPVRTGLGITTQIELGPDERVVDYGTGFSSGWELTRRDNVFYLKPRNVDVDTNLVVRTEAHSYIFELRVVATDWKGLEQAKSAGVQYRIGFRYPAGTSFRAAADKTPRAAALDPRPAPGGVFHHDYDYATRTRMHGLIPVSVHDDGRFTYIRLSDAALFPSGSFPAVFARHEQEGEEFVVNTTVEGGTVAVHGTYPYLVIRHGDEVVALRRNGTR